MFLNTCFSQYGRTNSIDIFSKQSEKAVFQNKGGHEAFWPLSNYLLSDIDHPSSRSTTGQSCAYDL